MAKAKRSNQASDSCIRYVAFLRAINVGKRTVKSPQLIDLFSQLGFGNVSTFLASGNVIFDALKFDAPKKDEEIGPSIERAFEKSFGFPSAVFLRTLDRLEAIVAANPLQLTEQQKSSFTLNVLFLQQPVSNPIKKRVLALRSSYDDFAFDDEEILWLCRGEKISVSSLFEGDRLGNAIGVETTMRNVRTLSRIVQKERGY